MEKKLIIKRCADCPKHGYAMWVGVGGGKVGGSANCELDKKHRVIRRKLNSFPAWCPLEDNLS